GKFTEGELTVHLPQDVAIYLLNNKRAQLHEIEARTGIAIAVEIDAELNAMEMSITLPDNSEAGGVSRMEGDPAAVAEDNGSESETQPAQTAVTAEATSDGATSGEEPAKAEAEAEAEAEADAANPEEEEPPATTSVSESTEPSDETDDSSVQTSD
ncbi:MAG: hypothetical protein EBR20_11675, partial [Bacteroidetes bacterium]|nr:hypothetical protein [Bacteroidota bacterium]